MPKHLPGNNTKAANSSNQQESQKSKIVDSSKNENNSHNSNVKVKEYAVLATQAEFDAIPSSTKLRCTLDEINTILTSIQNLIIEKQQDNSKKKSKKNKENISLTEDELNSIPVLKKSLDGKTRALIHTLRSLGRLKASIKDGKAIYIVVASESD